MIGRGTKEIGLSPPSLEDIHASVPIPRTWWRRFLAFSGPAFIISVGYMDPGNWATDLKAGSAFRYQLVWILLFSNLMALLLQRLATRLGVVNGRDLAQACRESYPRSTVMALWILTEIAIAATDLAEVIGTVIALKLFGLPYSWGLALAAGDTFVLLALQKRGVRLLELVTLALVAVIAVSFVIEIVLARPDWGMTLRGFIPTLDSSSQDRFAASLYVAIGMMGATVMPHNLYLHSALVQTRDFPQTERGKRLACKYNLIDSFLALNGAFLINAAILVLAAARLYDAENPDGIDQLQKAHELLKGAFSAGFASFLFALALLASGQSSTLTGTLAGQVVMEGFVQLRLRPWVRRLVTRLVAIVPAVLAVALAGNETVAGAGKTDDWLLDLLVLSQVILNFQLPFAIIPLIVFTSDHRRMGNFANGKGHQFLAWASAAVVIGLNVLLCCLQIIEWAHKADGLGISGWWVYATAGPLALALGALLVWVALYPSLSRRELAREVPSTPSLPAVRFGRIGVAVEFSPADDMVLTQAAALARTHKADLVLVHVVEGMLAAIRGSEADDQESRADRLRMTDLTNHLQAQGLYAEGVLGYGSPPEELVRIAMEKQFDILVLGTHGHRFFADLALGQTVSPVLHRLSIPVLVVPSRP